MEDDEINSEHLSVRLKPSEMLLVKAAAKGEGRSTGNWARRALMDAVSLNTIVQAGREPIKVSEVASAVAKGFQRPSRPSPPRQTRVTNQLDRKDVTPIPKKGAK